MTALLAAQNHLLLSMDGILVSFPQRQGTVIDIATEVEATPDINSSAIGVYHGENYHCPVYSVNSRFEVLFEVLQEQRFCVCFGMGTQQAFALLCNEVSNIKSFDGLQPEAVPECMHTDDLPISHLVFYKNELVFVADHQKMYKHVRAAGNDHG